MLFIKIQWRCLIKDLITFIKKNLKTYLSTIYNQEISLGICANRQVWRRNISSYWSSHREVFCKKGALKNFAKFIGVSLWLCEIFENTFFTEHFWTIASVSPGAIKTFYWDALKVSANLKDEGCELVSTSALYKVLRDAVPEPKRCRQETYWRNEEIIDCHVRKYYCRLLP